MLLKKCFYNLVLEVENCLNMLTAYCNLPVILLHAFEQPVEFIVDIGALWSCLYFCTVFSYYTSNSWTKKMAYCKELFAILYSF